LSLFIQQLKTGKEAKPDEDNDNDPPAAGSSDGDDSSRPRGRHPLAPHLKRKRVEHDLAEEGKHCDECQHDLRPIGEETSERYEYIPAQFLVIEDVCKKYACECTVKTATKPPEPIAKSAAGASLLAHVIVGKVADRLPIHRQGKMLRRFGVDIPDQTMCGWMRQSAELPEPLYDELKEFVLSSKVTGPASLGCRSHLIGSAPCTRVTNAALRCSCDAYRK
jgi:transposase